MYKRILVYSAFLLGILAGCASDKTTNPITNDPVQKIRPFNTASADSTSNNRYLFGYWDVYIPENRESIELYPLRTTDLHLNAVRWLEVTPCLTCLTVENVTILPSGLLSAGFRLQHPFPGLDQYTGFDVRGIMITGGNYEFEFLVDEGGRNPEDGRHLVYRQKSHFPSLCLPPPVRGARVSVTATRPRGGRGGLRRTP